MEPGGEISPQAMVSKAARPSQVSAPRAGCGSQTPERSTMRARQRRTSAGDFAREPLSLGSPIGHGRGGKGDKTCRQSSPRCAHSSDGSRRSRCATTASPIGSRFRCTHLPITGPGSLPEPTVSSGASMTARCAARTLRSRARRPDRSPRARTIGKRRASAPVAIALPGACPEKVPAR